MNVEELSYHDYLLNINDASNCAISYHKVVNGLATMTPEESAYNFYRNNLLPVEQEESDYAIFSSLFDLVPEAEHPLYETEFFNIGQPLEIKCRRKRNPNND